MTLVFFPCVLARIEQPDVTQWCDPGLGRLKVARTPRVAVRVAPEVADAARAAVGEPDLDVSVLLRAGLLVLSGVPVREALESATVRRGRRPKVGAGS